MTCVGRIGRRRDSIRNVAAALAVVLALAAGATALARGPRLPDPKIIVVRNESGADLERFELTRAKAGKRPARIGAVSPVPSGVSQSVTRSSRSQPLDRRVLATWVVRDGGEYAREVDLKPVISGATGAHGEALVFRIGPGQTLDVLLEIVDPGNPGGFDFP